MALTYRSTKGSALTIAELDGNFQYFTGSHSVTGSITTSGSLIVSGSTTLSGSGLTNVGTFIQDGNTTISGSLEITGSLTLSGSLLVSGSLNFTGLPKTEPLVTGSIWCSGSGIGDASGSKYLMVFTGMG